MGKVTPLRGDIATHRGRGKPSLEVQSCLWCGNKNPEFRLVITRTKKQSSRSALRFWACSPHIGDILDQLERVVPPDKPHLRYLWDELCPGRPIKRLRLSS